MISRQLDRDREEVAREVRARIVATAHRSRISHVGSALSTVEILVALYWDLLQVDPANPEDPQRDRFIFSKGHAALALYTSLALRGFFPVERLGEANRRGPSPLPEQPSPGCAPGVEFATGSLGHGLPVGVGLALAGRIDGHRFRTFVLMSDGECNEGSVWEAAMLASRQGLSGLNVLVDANGWQATDRTKNVLGLEPQREKWSAFGWESFEVDGHSIEEITEALTRPAGDRPRAVIARTVKGKGVSFMEDDNNWHYRIPAEADVRAAARELAAAPEWLEVGSPT